ncbi:MAG: ABC transporter permease [Myxococcales bacterium]|nr:ABC transporter permease [Myxococcales bacterium]
MRTDAPHSGSYWSEVSRQFRKGMPGMVGLAIAVGLLLVALLAPVIANDRPVVCHYRGSLSFPAMTSYVDAWVPWQGMRYDLKSLRVGGTFPLSDHYAELEGRTWKDVADSEDMSFALWPPIPWHPNQFDKDAITERPSRAHVLGTDDQGRDVLARLVHGTVVAWLVGVISMSIAGTIGTVLGVVAGFLGGWVDLVLSRLVEVVICFPAFFLIIAVIAFLEPSIVNIMVVLGCIRWTGIFRLVRGEVLATRDLDYVQAARALGVSDTRIMFRHVLPNAVSPVFVALAFGIAGAILTETSLSFLGFGDPSVASWGEIVQQGRTYVSQGLWHLTVFPGVAIFLTLTAFNLFGQGLRDAMDPKLRGRA